MMRKPFYADDVKQNLRLYARSFVDGKLRSRPVDAAEKRCWRVCDEALIALIRLFNLIAIKVKFGQWSMTHTIGNKVTGFLIYVFPLICVNSPYLFRGCFYLVSAMAALSALEECFLLFASDHYDVNRRSIFMK